MKQISFLIIFSFLVFGCNNKHLAPIDFESPQVENTLNTGDSAEMPM